MTRQIRVGDRVKYRVGFLRSIGAYTGPLPFARGTVTGVETYTSPWPSVITVDWNNEEVPARVLSSNLVHADRIELD